MRTGAVDSSRNTRRKRSPKPSKRNKHSTPASSVLNNSNSNISSMNATATTRTDDNITSVAAEDGTEIDVVEQVELRDEEIHRDDTLLATTPVTGLGTVVDIQESFQVYLLTGYMLK